MKRFLCITLFLCIIFPVAANAAFWDLSASSEGGTGSATLDVTISGNFVTAIIDNTSPLTLDPPPDPNLGVNTPGITGFGFDLDSLTAIPTAWTLYADPQGGGAKVLIGGSSIVSPTKDQWVLDVDTKVGNISIGYYTNTQGSSAALYNPDATEGFATAPNYQTTNNGSLGAVLEMEFASLPAGLNPQNPFIRMQNVGLNGKGSLKLIPEPSTMIISGLFLLGAGVFVRRKLHRKS
jgi:hypothetical protein